MDPRPPPSTPEASGWTFSQYRLGYRANARATGPETMCLELAPGEVGPDSGLFAIDLTVAAMSYAVYVDKHPHGLKLPGCKGTVPPDVVFRAPGWNRVAVDDRVTINGCDAGPGSPSDVGCYAIVPGATTVHLAGLKAHTVAMPLPPATQTNFRFA